MSNWITALIVQLLVATIGSYVAGRLLGVRLSWGRWLVALAVGVSAGGVIAWLLAGRPMDGAGIDPGVVFVATFLVALAAAADPFGLLGSARAPCARVDGGGADPTAVEQRPPACGARSAVRAGREDRGQTRSGRAGRRAGGPG
jgi:hypothetical protein